MCAFCELVGQVLDEREGGGRITEAEESGHDQLAVGMERRSHRYVTRAFRSGLGPGDVLGLGVGERPDLVALHALHLDGPHMPVMRAAHTRD